MMTPEMLTRLSQLKDVMDNSDTCPLAQLSSSHDILQMARAATDDTTRAAILFDSGVVARWIRWLGTFSSSRHTRSEHHDRMVCACECLNAMSHWDPPTAHRLWTATDFARILGGLIAPSDSGGEAVAPRAWRANAFRLLELLCQEPLGRSNRALAREQGVVAKLAEASSRVPSKHGDSNDDDNLSNASTAEIDDDTMHHVWAVAVANATWEDVECQNILSTPDVFRKLCVAIRPKDVAISDACLRAIQLVVKQNGTAKDRALSSGVVLPCLRRLLDNGLVAHPNLIACAVYTLRHLCEGHSGIVDSMLRHGDLARILRVSENYELQCVTSRAIILCMDVRPVATSISIASSGMIQRFLVNARKSPVGSDLRQYAEDIQMRLAVNVDPIAIGRRDGVWSKIVSHSKRRCRERRPGLLRDHPDLLRDTVLPEDGCLRFHSLDGSATCAL